MSKIKHQKSILAEINNSYLLFFVGISCLLVFFSLDNLFGLVSIQPYYAYSALIVIICVPIIWLMLLEHHRMIHTSIIVGGVFLVCVLALATLPWIKVWGDSLKQIYLIPIEKVSYIWVILCCAGMVVWLFTHITKYRINNIAIAIVSLLLIVAALPFLASTASRSYHTEVTDSVVMRQNRYIVTRHRSHVDVENPALVILYQCNKMGMFCNELYRNHIPGYPSHYLLTDDTITLHGENKVIYEFNPQN